MKEADSAPETLRYPHLFLEQATDKVKNPVDSITIYHRQNTLEVKINVKMKVRGKYLLGKQR